MQVLAEMIDKIREIAVRENETLAKRFIKPPEGTEPPYIYFDKNVDGSLERREGDPGPRVYTVYRVKDFIAGMKHFPVEGSATAVFVGHSRISGLLDEPGQSRDRITLPLTVSGPFGALTNVANQGAMEQDDFIDFLRIKLAGCVDRDTIQLFRQLKFTNNSSGDASYETGKQQISKSVLREIAANGRDIPEEITLRVMVYEELWGDSLLWPVTCAVVIDFNAGEFSLIPLAGQLNKARIMTLENIADTIAAGLAGETTIVVCGEP